MIKNVDLLFIGDGEETLDSYQWFQSISESKYFCRYRLHAFITEEILKSL